MSDPTTSLLLTFGTFALSYITRPIGGVVLGMYADRLGRKASLLVSIIMMMFGTLVVGFMPGYATIGILAPVSVLLARLVQGFSAGGEFGSSTAFLVELCRNGAASSRAGNLPARDWPICSRPPLASA